MPVRRFTDPVWVQKIWDAIRWTLHQRQQTELSRLTNYLKNKRDHLRDDDSETQIQNALKDKLLISEHRTGLKGQKRGIISECYMIPSMDTDMPLDDGHDWYCIECHLAGDVICCTNCYRVFHQSCYIKKTLMKSSIPKPELYNEYCEKISDLNRSVYLHINVNTKENIVGIKHNKEDDINQSTNKKQDSSGPRDHLNSKINTENGDTIKTEIVNEGLVSSTGEVPILCTVCLLLQNEKDHKMGLEDFNYLLGFTFSRIRTWLPHNILDTMASNGSTPWFTDHEKTLRAKLLLYKSMDFGIIENKLQSQEYTKFTEFYADVLSIQHNVAIFHGYQSQEMEGSKLMIYDCIYDLVEIVTCPDCYRHSNEKSDRNWFCIPCSKPHELVWAKQKGYCYWPAKVIKKTIQNCDVRFFGSKHSRSHIENKFIKPIEINIQSLQIKRSSTFNTAYNELQFHKKLLMNPEDVTNLLAKAHIKKMQLISKWQNTSIKNKIKKSSSSQDQDQGDVCNFNDSSGNITDSSQSADGTKENVKQNGSVKNKPKSNKRKLSTQSQNEVNYVNDDSCESNTNSIQSSEDGPKQLKITPKVKIKKSKTIDKCRLSTSSNEANTSKKENSNEVQTSRQLDGNNKTNTLKLLDVSNEAHSQNNGPITDTNHGESRTDFVSSTTEKKAQPRIHRLSNTSYYERNYCEPVTKLRAQLVALDKRDEIIQTSLDYMQQEIEKIQNANSENLKEIVHAHNLQLSEIKKRQWCYNCEQEAIYHCCWNTAYCSTHCQQQHWQAEHKKVCRRKR